MNIILIISICAGVIIYFGAERLKINALKWAIITFFICYLSYYLSVFIANFSLYYLGLEKNKPLKMLVYIITYILPFLLLRHISKKMNENKENNSQPAVCRDA